MFQILETATLLRLLDAAPEAVHQTIEMGQWTGCLAGPSGVGGPRGLRPDSLPGLALFHGTSSGGGSP